MGEGNVKQRAGMGGGRKEEAEAGGVHRKTNCLLLCSYSYNAPGPGAAEMRQRAGAELTATKEKHDDDKKEIIEASLRKRRSGMLFPLLDGRMHSWWTIIMTSLLVRNRTLFMGLVLVLFVILLLVG
eukprot:763612-Hanusia_phi.AAC.25